jgi:hypothetical protein
MILSPEQKKHTHNKNDTDSNQEDKEELNGPVEKRKSHRLYKARPYLSLTPYLDKRKFYDLGCVNGSRPERKLIFGP